MSDWYDDEEVRCQNEYCFGNGYATWTGGAQKRGKEPPKQCNECWENNNNQKDVEITCENDWCRYKFTIWAKSIVWHRRNVGEWEEPTLCKRCEANPDLKPKEMTCQNASHAGGTFMWNPGEQLFYESKGLDPPELCKDCRQENKFQQDDHTICSLCEFERNISRRYIISWRRNEGEWKTPDKCRLCEQDPQRAENKRLQKEAEQKIEQFLEGDGERPYDEIVDEVGRLKDQATHIHNLLAIQTGIIGEIRTDLVHAISEKRGVTEFDTLTDANKYAQMPDKSGNFPNRLRHIMNHFDHFEAYLGAQSMQDALEKLEDIAESIDTSRVVEFETGRDRVAKYDTRSGMVVILEEYPSPPPQSSIVTAFHPSDGIDYVARQINNDNWT